MEPPLITVLYLRHGPQETGNVLIRSCFLDPELLVFDETPTMSILNYEFVKYFCRMFDLTPHITSISVGPPTISSFPATECCLFDCEYPGVVYIDELLI